MSLDSSCYFAFLVAIDRVVYSNAVLFFGAVVDVLVRALEL